MPMVAQWDINDDCNLNCKHCRVLNKNTQEKELTLEQAKRLLLWYNQIKPFRRRAIFKKRLI